MPFKCIGKNFTGGYWNVGNDKKALKKQKFTEKNKACTDGLMICHNIVVFALLTICGPENTGKTQITRK